MFKLTYRTILLASATMATAGLLATTPVAAVHPNQPRGFDPERTNLASVERIDAIDLFTGSLTMTIPIGPLTLNYSSNVWRYETTSTGGIETIEAFPDRRVNAGLGWHLGWGEVYHPDHAFNDTGHWLFVDRGGARHTFYQELHKDDDSASDAADVFYTRDNSYLRLAVPNNVFVDIAFPDGTTRRYDSGTGGLQSTYYWHKEWSPFSSADDPDLWVLYDREPSGKIIGLDRTINDRHGRTHHVELTDQYHWLDQVVSRVDLEGFAGQRTLYDFSYDEILVNRSCKDTEPGNNDRIAVPHLTAVTLPDGTAYRMTEGGSLLYYNLCRNEANETVDDVAGVLNGINLPTGGKIRWSFQEVEFPPGNNNSVFNTTAGVEHRRLLDAAGTELGSWRYKSSSFHPGNGNDPEVYTEVSVLPEGDCTKHYFNARYWVTPSQGKGWEYGLPFIYSAQAGGKYLSREVYTQTGANGSCAGSKLRSTYLRFRHDPTPGQAPSPTNGVREADFYNVNRTIEARRTVFHDDSDRYVDTVHSQFDGLGHFRQTVQTGTFRASSNAERRETFVGYNRTTGTYPGNYVQPGPDEPWILGIFAETKNTEIGAHGNTVARVEYGFEEDTGFLACTRILSSGTNRGAHDLLTLHTRDLVDPEGLVRDRKHYGGDNQTLTTTGANCGTVPAQPDYWNHFDYQYGVMTKVTPRHPNGSDGTFPTFDVDLDPSTGWVLRQRDASGYQVTMTYDQAGRLTWMTPQDGARSEFLYTNPATGTPALIAVVMRPASGGGVLDRREQVLDDFGRTRLERRLLPTGAYAERETLRNARGWTTSVSQWGNLAKKTQFLSFDPFGRPSIIRPPNGASHDQRITRLGKRVVTAESKIALAGGEAYVPKTHEYDRYGRLRTVTERSGTAPQALETPTTLSYDVNNLLTRVQSGVGTVQDRAYTYDNRGFMLSETHPEKGANGNGTVVYSEHDTTGLAHRVVDGPHDRSYSHDFLGRITHVRDQTQGNRLMTFLQWDTAAGHGVGSLSTATEYNYIDLPWNSQGEESLRVRQSYRYEGKGGAPSRKDTEILWSLANVSIQQAFTYDDLGNITAQTYPQCVAPVDCASSSAGTVRTVSNTFNNGALTNVVGWTNQIDYLASGAIGALHHANNVVDHFTPDPHFTLRARRLHTTGTSPASSNFDSGTMTYDGSGFLVANGTDTFTYDQAGRLAAASLWGGVADETYSYDRFANLTATGGALGSGPIAIDSSTNRLVSTPSITYDSAGNLEEYLGRHWRYDASDRLVAQQHMRYVYDASGERVMSIANGGLGDENAQFHLRDLGHRRTATIRMSDAVWTHERDYVYAGDRLLASTTGGPTEARHYHQDHLGSTRLITRADGTREHDYLYSPYGREEYGTVDDSVMFTGHERDFSTDADYMHARHYTHELGRFLSIDRLRGAPHQPQSLNRYAYVMGNPLNLIDPTGLSSEDDRIESHADGSAAVPFGGSIWVFAADPGHDPFVSTEQWRAGLGGGWVDESFGGGGSGGGSSLPFVAGAVTTTVGGGLGIVGWAAPPLLTPANAFVAHTVAQGAAVEATLIAEGAVGTVELANVQAANQLATARATRTSTLITRTLRVATYGSAVVGVIGLGLLANDIINLWDASLDADISRITARDGDAHALVNRLRNAQGSASGQVGGLP